MATFVIVHGAHSGSWIWQLVRNRLWTQGHTCFTPTLTGVGERAHLTPPALRTTLERMVQRNENGVLVLPPLPAQPHGRIGSGGLSTEEIQQRLARRVPVAFATFTQPFQLTNAAAVQAIPHCYIHCTDKGPNDVYASVAQQARERGWPVRELATGHHPMLTTPEELSVLLVEMGPV